ASVARNWVERGHYGRLALGENSAPGLEAALPLTGAVALSFKIFGIGLAQARAVVAIYLIAALILLFYLARRFYDRKVALGACWALLLVSGIRYIHPLFMGRQILAEVPALFFLLAGYVCFLRSLERRPSALLGAIIFWSLALITKAQVLPFWAASLALPLVFAAVARRWRLAAYFAAACLGSVLLGYAWLALIYRYLLPASSSVSGLLLTIALVLDPIRRAIAALTVIQIGLPTLLGLVWAFRNEKFLSACETPVAAVRFSYLILAGSWFFWWAAASTGWARYLFPASFLASIFVAAMASEWTQGFRIRAALREAATNLMHRRRSGRDGRVLAALVLGVWSFGHAVADLNQGLIVKTNRSLFETVDYLNTATPAAAVIETYESELFFFLKRRYHFPPDQTHVELIRREDLNQNRAIDYDPLAADPDYLVVGTWCRYYKCYEPALKAGAFKAVKTFGSYQIFQRVRETAP